MSLSHWKSLAVVPLLLCFACSPKSRPRREEAPAVETSQSSALSWGPRALSCGALSTHRHAAAQWQGAGGGGRDSPETASTELYDPATTTSSSGPALAAARRSHTATQLQDGSVLVVGGVGPGGILSSVERYQPSTNTWTAAASLPRISYGHSATLLTDGRVLVAGGVGSVGAPRGCLHPATKPGWPRARSTPRWAVQAAVRLADGRVLVAGGQAPPPAPPNLDALHRRVDDVASMNSGRSGHTLHLLSSGKVLASGYVQMRSSTTRRPTLWTNTSNTVVNHFSAPSVMRPDGSIILAGGTYSNTTVELYSPTTGSWSTMGALTQTRRNHPTVALPSGRVLFLGGTASSSSGSMVPVASIEVFDLNSTCTPTTCAAQGKNCGTISNGCGGTLTCGTCGSGQTCTNNVCGTAAPSPAPMTCARPVVC